VDSVTESAAPAALPEPAPRPPEGYLDAVGGQPLLPVAQAAWRAAAEQAWSDPARLHHEGRRAGMVLDAARASIAESLDVRPQEVFFTSSGPTAVGVAVQGVLETRPQGARRVVLSAVESLAVQSPAQRWAEEVDVVPAGPTGLVDVDAFTAALSRPAALACLQAANAEVGTRQPVAAAAAAARAAGVPLLVHAVQVVGRGPVPADWDLLAASARDWGGPAGVGVLAVRDAARWRPDENPDRGWAGGFPDIPGAAAAAAALEYLRPCAAAEAERQHALTAAIRDRLPRAAEGIVVAGEPDDRLPHVVTFTCAGVTGEVLVDELGRRGLSVASGSACTSDTRMPSQVLAAMGIAADASIRVSLPLGCRPETVEAFLAALPGAVQAARSGLGA
jgi:cysteine desulfurase